MTSTVAPVQRDIDILRSALDFYAPGSIISSDVMHEDLIVAAQIKPSSVGSLLGFACEKGWLREVGQTKSKRPEAKRRRILTYAVVAR